ncbi:hypothetical protein D0T25_30145 [Duganella sp. BJB488]|uniref:hypothetical protein n=1 Tax=unclassified Duganella TaxID=2636909 RepID=UPI000E3508D8|nr:MULTISPECIES: hypothetical protein [unclassified Duganella]NVD74552.1 hypothetical protein [Duganella sp. BJB1802]RFP09128.1 hypothetical protein D0T26_30305 [Duganella sp. BJB489]RFP12559.1 hypothetical protein D0T25_30145 [Duganella sp. BJB488]
MTQKDGITIPIFHGIFNGHESITHFIHDFDPALYELLPNLYATCIADNGRSPRKIVAGFFVKTSYHHDDAEFSGALHAAMMTIPALTSFVNTQFSLLPARLEVIGSEPLSEQEMLRTLLSQSLKHSTFGHA